jgi:uncharacterized coiled-coil protein SlyX
VPDVPPVPDEVAALRAANARLRQVVEAKDTEITALRVSHQAQLDLLRAQLAALAAEVADLRPRLGQDSRNSSKPPSQDGLARPAPRSLRGKSGRKPGRPKGQPRATLEFSGTPDEVVVHEPGRCSGCGKHLAGARVAGMIRRQVTDVPPVRPVVSGHHKMARR